MCSIACKLASFAPCFSLSFISETIVAQTPLSLKLCLITLKKGKATTNISPVSKKEHILPRSFLQNPNTNPKQTIDETAENAGGHFHTGRRREHSKVQDVPTLIPKHRAYKSPFWTGKVTCVCEIELGNRQGNFGSKRQLGQIKPRLDFVLFFCVPEPAQFHHSRNHVLSIRESCLWGPVAYSIPCKIHHSTIAYLPKSRGRLFDFPFSFHNFLTVNVAHMAQT